MISPRSFLPTSSSAARIETDAFVFHLGENGKQGRLDFVKDFFLARFGELGRQLGMELQRKVGPFHRAPRRKLIRIGRFHRGEKILLTGGNWFGNGRVVKKRFGDVGKGVAEIGEDDGVRQGRCRRRSARSRLCRRQG